MSGRVQSWRRWWPVGVVASIVVALLVGMSQAMGGQDTGTAHAAIPGRIAFGHLGDVWIAEGGNVHQVTPGGRYWGQPEWSPDGVKLALVGWGNSVTDLFLMNPDGSDLRQITQS